MVNAFWLSLSFLTVIPVPVKVVSDKEAFSKSIIFFPVIGLILGCCMAATWYIVNVLLSIGSFSAAVLTVFLLAALTRMLHLDGLSDTFDGLLGGRSRDHALEIMKDSRVGSFGVAALILVLLAKISLLSELSPHITLKYLLLFPVCARWVASYALLTQRSARKDGLALLFQSNRNRSGLIAPSIVAIVTSVLAFQAYGLIMPAAVFIFAQVFLKWVKRKIGGITGDINGALIELSEVIALFTSIFLPAV